MKPPISYYGGKQRMLPNILPLLPRHTVYVEPFAGGAAVLFGKESPRCGLSSSNYREVINDADGRLINFYRVLRDESTGPELIRRLELTPYAHAEHADALRATRAMGPQGGNIPAADDASPAAREARIEAARHYFVNISMSFANKLNAGWGTGVIGRNLSTTWANRVDRLPAALERLRRVHIECDDALAVIARWDSPQTLFYCDPPYVGTELGHYGGYTADDFARLVAALDACQGNVLLSTYVVDGVAIPADWERFDFTAQCSASGQGKAGAGRDKSLVVSSGDMGDRARTETVYRRYNSAPVRPDIQALYDSGDYDCYAFPPGERGTQGTLW